jgi:alpha-beta hydrolase superfamily lysophospholipase
LITAAWPRWFQPAGPAGRRRAARALGTLDIGRNLHRPMVAATLPPMAPTDSTFEGAGGMTLAAHRWGPAGAEGAAGRAGPRAAVAVVHGFGEHSGRYSNAVATLTARGFSVHGFDLRGHGRSGGRRGHVGAWAEYLDDLGAFIVHVGSQEPARTPVFLYGHSFGGALVLEYVLRRPDGVVGVVASAPSLVPSGVRSPALEALARALSRVWPTFSLPLPLETAAISRSPEVVAANRSDALNHLRITARTAGESLRAFAWTMANAPAWRLPLLVIHGGADRIIDPEGSRAFVTAARGGGATDVELRIYEGGYHEPHNDLEAERVISDVADWVEGHLPA